MINKQNKVQIPFLFLLICYIMESGVSPSVATTRNDRTFKSEPCREVLSLQRGLLRITAFFSFFSFPQPGQEISFFALCTTPIYQAQSRREHRSWIKAFNIWVKTSPSFHVYLPFCYNEKGRLATSSPMISVYSLFSVKSGYATVISISTPLLLTHVTCLFNHEVPHSHDTKSSVSVHST